MKTDTEFVNTLEDVIRKRGAMDKLISDSAWSETSKRVLDLLRAYCIDDWQSEPHHQHQNFAERRYQTTKRMTNKIMDRHNVPAYAWLLCLKYVCLVLNYLANKVLNYRTPYEVATGERPDISCLLHYHFFQPVYYRVQDTSFPSESEEKLGYWCGIHEHCGDALTYNILTADTKKVIPRSTIRPADEDGTQNIRAESALGERPDTKPIFIKDRHDLDSTDSA